MTDDAVHPTPIGLRPIDPPPPGEGEAGGSLRRAVPPLLALVEIAVKGKDARDRKADGQERPYQSEGAEADHSRRLPSSANPAPCSVTPTATQLTAIPFVFRSTSKALGTRLSLRW